MKVKKKIKRETGFTVIEVLVAIAIIAVGVLALAANTVSVTQGNRISANTTIATNLAQEKIEEVKAQSAFTDGTVTDTVEGSSGITFTRTRLISNSSLAAHLRQIDVTVSWTEYGVSRSVAFSTYVYTG